MTNNLMEDARNLGIIFSAMSDGVVLYDNQLRIVDLNPAALKLFGRSSGEMIGASSHNSAWAVTDVDGAVLDPKRFPLQRAVESGVAIMNIVIGLARPDAEMVWLDVSAIPSFHPGNRARLANVVVTLRDITDEWNVRKSLEAALEGAEAAHRAKVLFLSNMSHEIRTPLNGIVAVADALAATDLQPRQRDMLNLIKDSGRSLDRILSDILDLSSGEAAQLTLEEGPVEIAELIRDVVDISRGPAEIKGLSLELDIDQALAGLYWFDASRVRQVLAHVMSNALKFTDHGKITVRAASNLASQLLVSVSDTGIGFDSGQLERLFGRFEQADTSVTRRFGGTGLGLAICSDLVDLMGGAITARSTIGGGSTFTVSLPLRTFPETAPPSANVVCADGADQPMKILAVDDHHVNRTVIQILLEPLGHKVELAENGCEALKIWKREHFDLILMDMQMPVMDGLSCVLAIREAEVALKRPPVPIAFLTANIGEEHRRLARDAGGNGYITKPLTLDSLIAGMAAALE